MNKNIEDYVKVYRDVLDKEFCTDLTTKLDEYDWQKHSYYDAISNTSSSYKNDLSIAHGFGLPEESTAIMKKTWDCIHKYITELDFHWFCAWSGFTDVRYNRYDSGTEMRIHCDHIHSMFDGERKGVPILTVLGSLNDNYTGGEFIMWDNEPVEIPAGSIAIFPANFLYPHAVKPINEGIRYSFVSWVW